MDRKIFIDESFDIYERLSLLGAISIPDKIIDILSNKDILFLNKYSATSYSKLMFRNLSGKNIEKNLDKSKDYFDWFIKSVRLLNEQFKVNIIDFTSLKDKKEMDGYHYLVYNKLPERLVYGFLKHDKSNGFSNIRIYVDSSYRYVKYDMSSYLKNQLNATAIYRNLNYKINKVETIYKNINELSYVKRNKLKSKYVEKMGNIFENLVLEYKNNNEKKRSRFHKSIISNFDRIMNLSVEKNRVTKKDRLSSRNSFGVSIIDFILNIVRVIKIINTLPTHYRGAKPLNNYKPLMRNGDMIFYLLKKKEVRDILCNIRLFELNGHEEMYLKSFKDDVDFFTALWGKNYEI